MRDVKFPCPHCGERLTRDADAAGGVVACFRCGRDVVTPQTEVAGLESTVPFSPAWRAADKKGGGWYLLLLLGPALALFAMRASGMKDPSLSISLTATWTLSVVAALYCGCTMAIRRTTNPAGRLALGLIFSGLFFVFCFATCFAGCIAGSALSSL